MPQSYIFGFYGGHGDDVLFFCISQYYDSIEKETIAHYQLAILRIPSKIAVSVACQTIVRLIFCIASQYQS